MVVPASRMVLKVAFMEKITCFSPPPTTSLVLYNGRELYHDSPTVEFDLVWRLLVCWLYLLFLKSRILDGKNAVLGSFCSYPPVVTTGGVDCPMRTTYAKIAHVNQKLKMPVAKWERHCRLPVTNTTGTTWYSGLGQGTVSKALASGRITTPTTVELASGWK